MPEPSTQELIDAAMRAVNDPGQFVERYGLRHTHLETGCGCAGGFETLNNWQRRALALAFEPLLDGFAHGHRGSSTSTGPAPRRPRDPM